MASRRSDSTLICRLAEQNDSPVWVEKHKRLSWYISFCQRGEKTLLEKQKGKKRQSDYRSVHTVRRLRGEDTSVPEF